MDTLSFQLGTKKEIDNRIVDFLSKQKILTLATCNDNVPHSAICFYVFDPSTQSLFFKSSENTVHIKEATMNKQVAGTIVSDKQGAEGTQGIQFTGCFSRLSSFSTSRQGIYYKKYPYALTIKGEVWRIELNQIKFTDNRMGFGKKICWGKVVTPPF